MRLRIVSREERRAHFRRPRLSQRGEFGPFDFIVCHGPQRTVLDVAEGSEHAGDIAQRRMFGAPLLERVTRLAFEVDDDEVVAGQEHLTQVIITVNPYLLPLRVLRRAPLDQRQQGVLTR